jgi:hypothetical protein
MELPQLETSSCPAVVQYDLAANGRHDAPAVIFVRKAIPAGGQGDATDLVVVSGPLAHRGAEAKAVQLAARYPGPTLRIAVCQFDRDDGPRPVTASPALLAAFDAVFVVAPSDSAQWVRRLVRALTVPDDSSEWIGCEWSDVRHLVAAAHAARPARHGFGAASEENCGSRRADAACAAAIAHMERQGACLRDAKGVCIAVLTAGPALPGKEALEVVTRLRAALHPAATIIQCLGCDDTLAPGTLDVSVFAFGTHDAAEAVPPRQLPGQAPDSVPLYEQARALVLHERRASVSLVQRHLHIGYRHAVRLLDAMEGDVLAPQAADGSRALLPAPVSTNYQEINCP